jgi:gas vesicle protein
MKFFSAQLITLITATTSFAAPFLERRDMFSVSRDCRKAAKQYEECVADIHLSNIQSVCATFNSEKCLSFRNNGFLFNLAECKNETQDNLTYSSNVFEARYIETKFRCTNDESGNICPINKYELESVVLNNYDQPLKDTCKSQACSNAYVEYINNIKTVLEALGDNIEDQVENKTQEIEDKLDNLKNNIEDKVEDFGDKIEDSIKGIFDKRYYNKVDYSLLARRDYLISNKCATITTTPTTIVSGNNTPNGNNTVVNVSNNGQYGNGNATSDATVVSKCNTFVIALVLIIATLL